MQMSRVDLVKVLQIHIGPFTEKVVYNFTPTEDLAFRVHIGLFYILWREIKWYFTRKLEHYRLLLLLVDASVVFNQLDGIHFQEADAALFYTGAILE